MFYKKEKNGNWQVGQTIHLPSGEVLCEDNKHNSEGWQWYDTSPQEYLEWKENKETQIL